MSKINKNTTMADYKCNIKNTDNNLKITNDYLKLSRITFKD